jgi:hypothetical protein
VALNLSESPTSWVPHCVSVKCHVTLCTWPLLCEKQAAGPVGEVMTDAINHRAKVAILASKTGDCEGRGLRTALLCSSRCPRFQVLPLGRRGALGGWGFHQSYLADVV